MYKPDTDVIAYNYDKAKATYKAFGVDTDRMMDEFRTIPISLHNWQGDDVK